MVATSRLEPVEKQTLAQIVMQRLMEHIQSGELAPGDVSPLNTNSPDSWE